MDSDGMQGDGRSEGPSPFASSATQQTAESAPALRVARQSEDSCVAPLAQVSNMGCDARLALPALAQQRTSRTKPDRLLGHRSRLVDQFGKPLPL